MARDTRPPVRAERFEKGVPFGTDYAVNVKYGQFSSGVVVLLGHWKDKSAPGIPPRLCCAVTSPALTLDESAA